MSDHAELVERLRAGADDMDHVSTVMSSDYSGEVARSADDMRTAADAIAALEAPSELKSPTFCTACDGYGVRNFQGTAVTCPDCGGFTSDRPAHGPRHAVRCRYEENEESGR